MSERERASVRGIVDLTCKEVVEIVGDYLAGDLPSEDRVRFEQHVHACTWCMTYLDQIRATRALAGSLNEETLSAAARQQLLEAFRYFRRR